VLRIAACSALALALALSLAACSGDSSGDAGIDASADTGVDFGRDSGPRDMGPVCTTACTGRSVCCDGPDGGATFCASYDTDDQNCGGCGIVCAAGRGTRCVTGHCVCGITDIGCVGTTLNFCCPPRSDAGMNYCANFAIDGTDCGSCNHACDPAMGASCSGGHCYCGTRDSTVCGGAETDHCCVDDTGQGACIDLLTDREHCGDCARRCLVGQPCVDGVCTTGPEVCPTRCETTDTCCHGVCCTDASCSLGSCGGPVDAGP
jgi:hypothetical protein